MGIVNHVRRVNKGSFAGTANIEILQADDEGNITTIKMDGLPSVASDYSLQNLDKAGIMPTETDPSLFRPVDLNASDSIIAASEKVASINIKKTNEK